MKLVEGNLQAIADNQPVLVPNYDRATLTAGIVHIGVGNFHRAHQAWYLQRLLAKGLNQDWAIVGAGVRPNDEVMRQKLQQQDYLTTLIELSPASRRAEIIGSMIDYVPVAADNAPLIARMAQADIRIVTLTVTEGGYYIDPASKGFAVSHADIIHDAENPDTPVTAFGAIIAALKRRRDSGIGPLTLQSCDNLQGNGNILRQTVIALATLSDPELAAWINQHCSFPNSMVDCIVPATGDNERNLARELGLEDAVPVTHEDFRQWVIEDNFCAGRPDWDRVGATFSHNVHAYETMKIRVLNGGHQIIAAAGDLLGIETISQSIAHPLIAALFDKVEREEIIANVTAVPEYTPEAYLALIKARFANPAIVDTTRRVAFDGSSRQPGFILPSVRDTLRRGGSVSGLALVSAIWARYCQGIREDDSEIEANDPYWPDLQKRALQAKQSPQRWLDNTLIYGDLGNNPAFSQAFIKWLTMLNDSGLSQTLSHYLDT
ncbi:MAG: mannitol dehydrogenase [Gammaproteobacteria bacterium]|nr:MAG: mannitol dehydrogenase [Gammaproteobacteria bacterium]